MMMVSSRGRYALRVMVCFAQRGSEEYIPLKEIAEKEGFSQKYLESIMTTLSKAGFVDAVHGKGGGYRLTREPEEYRIGDILRLTEGDLAPVACVECGAEPCHQAGECRTYSMWGRFNILINDFFDSITIADLMRSGEQI